MRNILLVLLLLVRSVADPATGAAAAPAEITGRTMGTTYSVKWFPENAADRREIQQAVDDRLAEINSAMSTYDPDSELSRFNSSDSTDWFEVSADTALVVQRALEVSRLSEGAFDPTVGPLVALWGFGNRGRTTEPPSEEAIAQALASVGFERVQVRLDPPALRKNASAVNLDLSGIAKGFGVDAVSILLSARGLRNHLVEIGGEARARGQVDGRLWRMGIERPSPGRSRLAASVELADQSLATSGDYRNFFEKDGVRYSHTIDPSTGRPVTHALAAASVVMEDCMSADAMATTLMALGPERGLEFANGRQLAAYFLVHEGERVREVVSERGAELFRSQPERIPPPAAAADNGRDLLKTFFLTAAVFGLAVLGLALGVLLSNRQLKGSCGGLSGMKDEHGRSICESCTTPPEECDRVREAGRQHRVPDEDGDPV